MRGSVHILVPKLIAKVGFNNIDKMCRERNCQARGSSGEHSVSSLSYNARIENVGESQSCMVSKAAAMEKRLLDYSNLSSPS